MKILKIGLITIGIIQGSLVRAEVKLPEFSQYPVPANEIFKGKPTPVDLSSFAEARTYRTRLQEGAAKGPNFAGHYTIVQIGCGTNCQDNWIIDAKTGKILNRFPSVLYTKYQLNNSLLIVNPRDPDFEKGYASDPTASFWDNIQMSYLVWEGEKFKVLYQGKWVDIIKATK